MNISEQLNAFMQIKKITKKQMSEDLSLPLNTIYNATRKQGVISDNNLKKICETYNTPSFYFTSYDIKHPVEQFNIDERICRECYRIRYAPLDVVIPSEYHPYVNIQGIKDKTHFPSIKELAIILSVMDGCDFFGLYYGTCQEYVEERNPQEFKIILNELEYLLRTLSLECFGEQPSVKDNVLSTITNNLVYKSSFEKKKLDKEGAFEKTLIIDSTYLTLEDEKQVIQFAKYLSKKNTSSFVE